MRKTIAVAVTAIATTGLVGLVPAAANAACDPTAGCTSATFTLAAAGGIAIAVPDGSTTAVNVGSGSTGATSVSGSLGTVTVTDQRGALAATWTANAVASNFTTGGGSSNETVLASKVGYYAGVGTAALGQVGAFVPTGTLATPNALGSAAAVGSWSGTGNDTVSWTPTISFTLLPSQVAGTYSGTITHSLS